MKLLSNWSILISLALVPISAAQASDAYHRFWRGMKRAELSWDQFTVDLNQVFIPATVATGAGKGMIAYEPVLTEGAQGLPDEVALVSYADQATYNALYATTPGKAYQSLHWQYFDQGSSRSVVPQAFTGSTAFDQAYDLHPDYWGWQENSTTVLIVFRKPSEAGQDFLKRASEHLVNAAMTDAQSGVLDRVTLVSSNYWIEYVSAKQALGAESGADRVIVLPGEQAASARILPNSGINLQF